MLPFDLDKAKAGAPLVTRNGKPARFVAHVPECAEGYRLIVYIEGDEGVTDLCDSGRVDDRYQYPSDVFLAQEQMEVAA
jgi:hypothetical protein